jgi:hypothetical protein
MSSEIQKYIIRNIDKLDKDDRMELLTLIKRYNTGCIKVCSSGSMINLDRLDPILLSRIKAYVDNRIYYHNMFNESI